MAADSPRKVLVVDPDQSVRREVRNACEQDGYQVLEAAGAAEALRLVEHSRPNVVLLEVALPDGAGFDVCRELRKTDQPVPVIMMSERSDEIDVVVALEIGADDYVTKPLRLRELVARMTAHLRRTRFESAEAMRSRLEFRDLVIDVNERRTYKSGSEVELHAYRVRPSYLPSQQRRQSVEPREDPQLDLGLRVPDRNPRHRCAHPQPARKIETQPSRPYYILAVPGIGYRFTNARPA